MRGTLILGAALLVAGCDPGPGYGSRYAARGYDGVWGAAPVWRYQPTPRPRLGWAIEQDEAGRRAARPYLYDPRDPQARDRRMPGADHPGN
ncbi:MAG TPA: hypothetical protein VD970_13440 [Acetobacteraceae bacterium]|nr:hypothetical protein [Acetobacteraceae bacterium]